MHASSLENMSKCYERFVGDEWIEARGAVTVLDVGGANVGDGNKRSYRDIFSHPAVRYMAADLSAEHGVDLVLKNPYELPIADGTIDIVISGQMLEHCEFFWLIFAEMTRVIKKDGLIILIAPSSGPIHQYPVDCYRFYPDAYRALAKLTNIYLWDVWIDNRGPWHNVVGVFGKLPVEKNLTEKPLLGESPAETFPEASAEEEKISGEMHYIQTLKLMHEILKPDLYFEVGVYQARSLRLAQCPAIAVDPSYCQTARQLPNVSFYQRTSDNFFEFDAPEAFPSKPDLIFIDGLHIFENVLRDFMNAEKIAHSSSVIVVDDISPNHVNQANRKRCTRVWTGDVWKLYAILKKYRPDLSIVLLNTSPTGLLVVSNLNPLNRVLWDHYDIVVDTYSEMDSPPDFIVKRENSIKPDGLKFKIWLWKISLGNKKNKYTKFYCFINNFLYRVLWKS